jgi:hypothetical protein
MKRVFSTGPKLITGLMLLLVAGAVMAKNTIPATYVKEGVDLSVYNKVMVKPLSLDNVEVLKPAWEEGNDDIWAFNPENRSDIQKWFLDAMQQEIEINGGYKLVTASGADVMRVEVEVLSITPYVKPGTQSSDSDHMISTLGSGDIVISAEFRDSKTRELLILVEGERTIGEKYRELSAENHIKNLKGMFTKWGKKVREALDKAHAE